MKIKVDDLVQVYFVNGQTAEGIVVEWSKKTSVLTSPSGKKLLIYRTEKNVQMVKKLFFPKPVLPEPELEIPVQDPYNTQAVEPEDIEQSLTNLMKEDQVWENNGTQWRVLGVATTRATIQHLHTKKILSLDLSDFLNNTWVMVGIYMPPVIAESEPPPTPTLQVPLESPDNIKNYKLKSIIELKQEQRQLELQKIRNNVKTFEPSKAKLTTYESPFQQPTSKYSGQETPRIA